MKGGVGSTSPFSLDEMNRMKKKIVAVMGAMMIALFPSCTVVKHVSFERLQGAEVNFPSQVKTVGVVNCVPVMSEQDWKNFGIPGFCEGEGLITTETFAQEIAETRYFEQVVIADSALVSLGADNGLSVGQIDSLIRSLDVDMLFTVERVKLQMERGMAWSSRHMREIPALHVEITPLIGVYKAGRELPLFKVCMSDTLSCEWSRNLPLSKIIQSASEHAATMPMKHLLPYWEEVHRYYFDGGKAEMRDAGVYLQEDNWAEAARLWKAVYDKEKGKYKMYAAFNLALFHEMRHEFGRAKEYLEVASRLAENDSSEQSLILFYLSELEGQSQKNERLQIQMKRFE